MTRPNVQTDRLPPHASEAEAAVLGCVLLDPALSTVALNTILERIGHEEPFYELRHAIIFAAMRGLHAEGWLIDVLTLAQRLTDTSRLEQAGGVTYLSSLPDAISSAEMLGHYLDIVWTKFLSRQGIRHATEWAAAVFSGGEMTVPLLADIQRRVELIQAQASRHDASPKLLKQPIDFADGFWNRFFGATAEEPGLDLPINFRLKIRPEETTLVTGDDGSGKSTVLNYFALHLAAAGQPVAVASFEMPPAVTLWILASQLLGAKRQPDAAVGHTRVQRALAWLNPRLWLYDFLGIGDWRDVLDTFRYAARHRGVRIFVLDSVMRIGIADDDYATQGMAAARFAQFAKDHQAHLFYVIHENKGDGKGKAKIRGSKLWSANADNVVRVERNADKGDKISKALYQIEVERKSSQPDQDEIDLQEKKIAAARGEWDTHLVLQKQRYPGTQQNASRFIFFDPENFQFRAQQQDSAINWLDRWSGRGAGQLTNQT